MRTAKIKADDKYKAANAQIKERNDYDGFDTRAGGRPAEAAFASVVPLKKSPTSYGKNKTSESFAECFRMYKADPDALLRAAPEALKWFKAGHHVRIAKKALKSR
ncbi:MAG: hypothetical protein GY822_04200 [Deltaproteobacteria bacterium]|nr:hypothetical protein [Deltaproteobacteria bacterium]